MNRNKMKRHVPSQERSRIGNIKKERERGRDFRDGWINPYWLETVISINEEVIKEAMRERFGGRVKFMKFRTFSSWLKILSQTSLLPLLQKRGYVK